MDSDCPQQTRSQTDLDPPLRGHFLLQRLVLQSSGSGLQLQPLIYMTPERFRLVLEQVLHKGQLRPEDPKELLDRRKTRGAEEKWESRRGIVLKKECFLCKEKFVNLFGGNFGH